VIQPVSVMGDLAQKISADEMVDTDLESEGLAKIASRADELGQLAQVFQRMGREVYARTQNLKQQVQQLRIQINESKRQEQVSEVVETDFFRDLQSKADTLRNKRRRKADQEPEQDNQTKDD
jgi:HAMP domain-containing protein